MENAQRTYLPENNHNTKLLRLHAHILGVGGGGCLFVCSTAIVIIVHLRRSETVCAQHIRVAVHKTQCQNGFVRNIRHLFSRRVRVWRWPVFCGCWPRMAQTVSSCLLACLEIRNFVVRQTDICHFARTPNRLNVSCDVADMLPVPTLVTCKNFGTRTKYPSNIKQTYSLSSRNGNSVFQLPNPWIFHFNDSL